MNCLFILLPNADKPNIFYSERRFHPACHLRFLEAVFLASYLSFLLSCSPHAGQPSRHDIGQPPCILSFLRKAFCAIILSLALVGSYLKYKRDARDAQERRTEPSADYQLCFEVSTTNFSFLNASTRKRIGVPGTTFSLKVCIRIYTPSPMALCWCGSCARRNQVLERILRPRMTFLLPSYLFFSLPFTHVQCSRPGATLPKFPLPS